jgi:2,3-bisphosphoglycerate-dependent phosphoglycerate mutase
MPKLVLLRHGESVWNRENRFTGWIDVPLSEKGQAEAAEAGRRLRAQGIQFDRAFTSLLKRAIKTLWIALEELDQMWIPVQRDWRWNERHYGALTGLDKAETAKRHGEAQVKIWRRSYDIPPPALERNDPQNPASDRRYASLAPHERPLTEALSHTVMRVVPAWNDSVVPRLRAGENVLIAAHGNSLRALVKHLEHISETDILELNIPTGMPRVYDLAPDLAVRSARYLASDAELAAAQSAVAAQGKAR